MAVKTKKNREYDVVDGKIVVSTPAVAATSENVPVARFDNQLARMTRQRDRAAARLAAAQAEYDELNQMVTDLTALRDQVIE